MHAPFHDNKQPKQTTPFANFLCIDTGIDATYWISGSRSASHLSAYFPPLTPIDLPRHQFFWCFCLYTEQALLYFNPCARQALYINLIWRQRGHRLVIIPRCSTAAACHTRTLQNNSLSALAGVKWPVGKCRNDGPKWHVRSTDGKYAMTRI